MPTAKGKGGGAVHRYRPASEYDNATLAQKREYWRNKKREQRARLSERRGKPVQASQGERLPHLHAPAEANSCLSDPVSDSCSSLKGNDSFSCEPLGQKTEAVGSLEANKSHKGKWLHKANLKVLSPLSASRSISTEPAGSSTVALKHPATRGALCRASTSPTSSGPQLNISSLVPPVRVTPTINGSSIKIAPQPYVSMQCTSVPRPQDKAQTTSPVQPKRLPTSVTAGIVLVSSPCGPVSIKSEGITVSPTPEVGKTSALVVAQTAKGNSQPSLESEEEKAARRREHWRIKKREQRAKLAAQLPQTRDRKQGAKVAVHRETTPGALAGKVLVLPSQPVLGGPMQRQGPGQGTFVKKEHDKLQSGPAAIRNLQTDPVKLPQGNQIMPSITADSTLMRRPLEFLRKLPNHVYVNSITRGMARCKTPRQRFIDAQKTFMNLRNLRCKSPFVSSVFGPRCLPRIDPSDTPEQIIAKRREYWRIKKREQRAKLSVEVKARLKEKDSLMRRVKRYQNILEEMRKARAPSRSTGGSLTHASETIGGFIKEDGTLTVNLPQSPTDYVNATNNGDEICRMAQNQVDTKHRGIAPIRIKPHPNPPRPPQVKVLFPLAVQSANKPPSSLSIRPHTPVQSTTVANRQPSAVQAVGQLTLTHPRPPQDALSQGPPAEPSSGGCVMKMAVSCSVPSLSGLSLDPGLTEEEKMAKKREYWRIKKREQRAARAFRLKQGVFQARALAALQRRKVQKQVPVTTVTPSLVTCTRRVQPLSTSSISLLPRADEIKQEKESLPAADLNSQLGRAVCPDIKPPTSPPPQPELDPALNADSQATTLLAVASMKKLLEESLSTVTERKNNQADIKMEAPEEVPEEDMKPHLPQLLFESSDVPPITADLTLQIKSWQEKDEDQISPQLKTSTSPPLPPAIEHSSQTSPSFIPTPKVEKPDGPSSPHLHIRNSPETPPLHEVQAEPDQPEPLQLHEEPLQLHEEPLQLHEEPLQLHEEPLQLHEEPLQLHDGPWKHEEPLQLHDGPLQLHEEPLQLHDGPWKHEEPLQLDGRRQRPLEAAEDKRAQPAQSSLQRKREYWKLMKRQQRARIKARQKDRSGECSRRTLHRNIQTPGLTMIRPKQPPAPPAAILLVTPPPLDASQPPDSVVSLPPAGSVPGGAAPPGWRCESREPAPCLPTLQPPDNPLSSFNLQPIEPPGHHSILSPIKIPCPDRQSPAHILRPPTKPVPLSTMVPPKPIPGESEEDFLRRKREYWRIKKKEQRARKAIRGKETPPKRSATSGRPPPPAQDPPTQDCDQQLNSDESQLLISMSMDGDPGTLSYSDYTAPLEDEPDFLLGELECPGVDGVDGVDEAPAWDGVWRSRYLMDYEPGNQLLVCMVCGELQYCHSLEAVRAHIEEAHPHTLLLDPRDQQDILEAWDEQVLRRERFFTNQLQQHGGGADVQRS